MKLIKYNKISGVFLGLFFITLLLNSCNEENVINLEPYNQISENVAFDTKENIVLSVNGMYQSAQVGLYNGTGRGYPFGAA